MPTLQHRTGFTLTETLMMVSIIVVMVVFAIVLIDPLERGRQANNARRRADIDNISNALMLLKFDKSKEFSTLIPLISGYQMITNGDVNSGGCAVTPSCPAQAVNGCVRLTEIISGYIKKPLADPKETVGSLTDVSGYYVGYGSGQVTVGACVTETDPDGTLPSIQVIW